MYGIALICPRALAPRELGWLRFSSSAFWFQLNQPVAATRIDLWGRSPLLVSPGRRIGKDRMEAAVFLLVAVNPEERPRGVGVGAAASSAQERATEPNPLLLELRQPGWNRSGSKRHDRYWHPWSRVSPASAQVGAASWVPAATSLPPESDHHTLQLGGMPEVK